MESSSDIPQVLVVAQELEDSGDSRSKYIAGLLRAEYLRAERSEDDLTNVAIHEVFILHPCHDYGARAVYSTLEAAEVAKENTERIEWEIYKSRRASGDSSIDLTWKDFKDRYYIHRMQIHPFWKREHTIYESS